MTPDDSQWSAAWRSDIEGWSGDILPWYRDIADKLPKPAQIVEIGVFHGRSLLFLAERLKALGHDASTRLVGVDMPVLDPNGHAALRRNLDATRWAWSPVRVELDLRPSVEAAANYADGFFDLVFIDADHEEASVRADIEAWRPKVRNGGGILSGHDYGWTNHPGVKAAVDALFGPVNHYESVWWLTVR